ncbi:uncharacterized protein LOC128265144 isoform X1 [Drosophila gunungcola]|uniref:Uncharacterized protein n=1 Tax=Drosophila gunungcola TaxID=103775 RepID=A0A9P9YBA0_9MUSC|nr:uncharacterized protein LOC128265144 isoform X1 [Drosophila gunungcola]XP_052856931.1 uncharacterized protein LOC128265144 isoform X1 [Drosophila gunungcola]KAI8033819.1 hypothetical protein M5D96_013403 [Drosophila gunungcola]
MLLLHLLLWPALIDSIPSPPSASQKAEVAKLRGELEKALEEDGGAPPGVVVAPGWTQQAGRPLPGKATKVVVDDSSLDRAAAIRQEIQQAVARQGQNPEVLQLEALLKARGSTKETPAHVGNSPREELLGAAGEDRMKLEANLVDSRLASQNIDLEQLQRLELSKRRTRDMLTLGRIEELLNFSLPAGVNHWLTLQANGSVYLVGQQMDGFLVLTGEFNPLQTFVHPSPVADFLGLDRWNSRNHVQEGLLVVASQDQLIWLRLEPSLGLTAFWHWSLGLALNKISAFSLEGRDFLALVGNYTLSIYAYDLEAEEFWIVQRLQLSEMISDLAILDTGRELLLAVGQWDEALIYTFNSKGEPLQLRQRIGAPEVTAITAFQMGGRSYLALGGILPQILVYMQGKLIPRTILGQNFGLVEYFLPVPVRSYRDDLLLLVQHRVVFDPHSLLVLEVLVWNGDAFEAGLPPLCGVTNTYGAACMLDQEQETGIQGAALLRQLDQPPLVLVPRKQAPSGLFRLEAQLLAKNSETHDLQEISQFMQEWVHEEEELIQLIGDLLIEDDQDSKHYEAVSTPLVVSEGGTIEELFVNKIRWTGADAVLNMHDMLEQIRLLDQDLSPKRSKRHPEALFNFHYEQLEVDAIESAELDLDLLNHVPFYIQNASLELPLGTLNVQQLELLKPSKEELVSVMGTESHEALELAGDFDCIFINGIQWDKLLQELVWRHRSLKISQLNVEGPVIFEDALYVNSLNDLSFPGDFLWSQENETSVVQAPKEFTQTLSTNVVDTSGTINGVNLQDAITLSDSHDWPGWVTFSHLEVSEELAINGSAQGRLFEEAPLNPTLLESRIIHSDCHFDQLFVKGPVRMLGKLDNDSFDSLLGDLVQRAPDSGQELLIGGGKRLDQLLMPVDTHVADNELSGIPLTDFVTKHTPQTLRNLTQLGGYVYFHQLEIGKGFSYNGVRLHELLSNSLRLNGSPPLISPLTRFRFVGSPPELTRLLVDHSLNQRPLSSDYQLLHEPLYLNRAHFSRLEAEQAEVAHDVTGSGLLNGQSLGNLLQKQPRTWSGEVHVQELILPQGVQANQLQGIKANLFLDFLQQLDELPLLILQGRLQVERIAVSGSVQVAEALNKRDFNEIQRQVVWLDKPNELRTRWILRESPQFQGNLQLLGSFNERLFPELLEDIVLRSEGQEVLIEGTKSFLAPVHAEELHLAAVNGIPFERLANKVNPLNLTRNVRVQGRLFVEDLRLNGQLNGDTDSPAQLERLLRWDPTSRTFIQRGAVELPRKELEHLVVRGHLGHRSREPLQELFEQLIFKQQPGIRLQGHKTFTGRFRVEHGAYINVFNALNLEQLLRDLVFVDSQEEVVLETPVRFAAAVKMAHLQAERLVLSGELLNGCNVSQWLCDTIRVDNDFKAPKVAFSQGSLDGNSLDVEELNQVVLSQVVTRHTEQHLGDSLTAQELFLDGQLVVRGNVNGRNLSEEYANTLMVNPHKKQRVETPLFMSGINVVGSLKVTSPVKGLNLSDVAILAEDPVRLQAPLYLHTLNAPFLRADQNLNGFDFKDWHQRSLWALGREQQEITGNWRVKKLRVKQADELRPRRQTAEESYWELCERLARILLPYQVQKLRNSFSLRQEQDQADVRRVFALEAEGGTSYLLINEHGCWTRIHRWNGTAFDRSGAFQSGPVDEVAALGVGNKSSTQEFAFMTSYEMPEDEHESSWNCSGMKPNLLSWQINQRKDTKQMDISADTLRNLKDHYEKLKHRPFADPSYQQGIKYLKSPTIESHLGSKWQEDKYKLDASELARIRRRLLETLEFRLQAEVNITQLSIPESDLFDEHLVEDFLELMRQLRGLRPRLKTDTLPLPDTPARVLAARTAQLIWPVLQELRGLSNGTGSGHQEKALEQTLLDVLGLANNGNDSGADDNLHAVIQRLRRLKDELYKHVEVGQEEPAALSSDKEEQFLPLPNVDIRPVKTLRLHVGPTNRPRLLYARLTVLTPTDGPPPTTPSTAPGATIQLHHANGSLFQSLAAERGAGHLTTLRVRDETLLSFVEGCCWVRVLAYRGVQGFVDFARFRAPHIDGGHQDGEVLQLLSLRLPLNRPPGAKYLLAVVQARGVTFYELVIAGLLEPWLKCT